MSDHAEKIALGVRHLAAALDGATVETARQAEWSLAETIRSALPAPSAPPEEPHDEQYIARGADEADRAQPMPVAVSLDGHLARALFAVPEDALAFRALLRGPGLPAVAPPEEPAPCYCPPGPCDGECAPPEAPEERDGEREVVRPESGGFESSAPPEEAEAPGKAGSSYTPEAVSRLLRVHTGPQPRRAIAAYHALVTGQPVPPPHSRDPLWLDNAPESAPSPAPGEGRERVVLGYRYECKECGDSGVQLSDPRVCSICAGDTGDEGRLVTEPLIALADHRVVSEEVRKATSREGGGKFDPDEYRAWLRGEDRQAGQQGGEGES